MQMHVDVKDDWMFEEPTVAEEEREAVARQNMARAVADQVRTSAPIAAVLVVARGPGVPTGVIVADGDRRHGRELDGVVLAEILSSAGDDRTTLALTRLVLGNSDVVEHAVARDRSGAVMGVIAVRIAGRVSTSWLRSVLARAANSLAGWLALDTSWPPQSLIEAIDEPALAHESGIVLVANSALARMLGRETTDVIGMPVSRIKQRLTLVRSCSLVVGGRARPALIFEAPATRPTHTSLLACLERVLATRYPFLRQTTRISIERGERALVNACESSVTDIIDIALLDMTAMFANAAPANHLRCSIYRDDASLVFELVATGSICAGPDIEHLGAVICASRVRTLGGHFYIDTSNAEARVVRIALPVAK
jgi:hypothetical protein